MGKEKGMVSVLVAAVIFPIIVLAILIVDISRLEYSKNLARESADLALDSILSRFNFNLNQYYGFFGSKQIDEKEKDSIAKIVTSSLNGSINYGKVSSYIDSDSKNKIKINFNDVEKEEKIDNITGLRPKYLEVEALENSSLRNSDIINYQIAEYMKYRAPITLTSGFFAKLKQFKGKDKEAILTNKKIETINARNTYVNSMEELFKNLKEADIKTKVAFGYYHPGNDMNDYKIYYNNLTFFSSEKKDKKWLDYKNDEYIINSINEKNYLKSFENNGILKSFDSFYNLKKIIEKSRDIYLNDFKEKKLDVEIKRSGFEIEAIKDHYMPKTGEDPIEMPQDVKNRITNLEKQISEKKIEKNFISKRSDDLKKEIESVIKNLVVVFEKEREHLGSALESLEKIKGQFDDITRYKETFASKTKEWEGANKGEDIAENTKRENEKEIEEYKDFLKNLDIKKIREDIDYQHAGLSKLIKVYDNILIGKSELTINEGLNKNNYKKAVDKILVRYNDVYKNSKEDPLDACLAKHKPEFQDNEQTPFEKCVIDSSNSYKYEYSSKYSLQIRNKASLNEQYLSSMEATLKSVGSIKDLIYCDCDVTKGECNSCYYINLFKVFNKRLDEAIPTSAITENSSRVYDSFNNKNPTAKMPGSKKPNDDGRKPETSFNKKDSNSLKTESTDFLSSVVNVANKIVDGFQQAIPIVLKSEYINTMFSNYADFNAETRSDCRFCKKKNFGGHSLKELSAEGNFGCEVEYILYGKGDVDCKASIGEVRSKIYIIRILLNLPYSFLDSEINTFLTSASAIAGPFAPAFKIFMHIALSLAESYMDTWRIMDLQEVALFKTPKTWLLKPSSAEQVSTLLFDRAFQSLEDKKEELKETSASIFDKIEDNATINGKNIKNFIDQIELTISNFISDNVITPVTNLLLESYNYSSSGIKDGALKQEIDLKIERYKKVINNSSSISDNLKSGLNSILENAKTEIYEKVSKVTQKTDLNSFKNDMAEFLNQIQSDLNRILRSEIKSITAKFKENINSAIKEYNSFIKSNLDKAKEKVNNVADSAVENIKAKMEDIYVHSFKEHKNFGKEVKDVGLTFNYSDYLRLFTLMRAQESEVDNRMMNIIEANMKKKDKDFKIDDLYSAFKVKNNFEVDTVILGNMQRITGISSIDEQNKAFKEKLKGYYNTGVESISGY